MPTLRTPRLLLIPATPATLAAELVSAAALGESLGVGVSASWPPELYDADAVRWTLNAFEDGRCAPGWCLFYFPECADAAGETRLIGVGGFRGEPTEDGVVEVGYGVVPESRRRGYAREAVDGLVGWAFDDSRVSRVIAHTRTPASPTPFSTSSVASRTSRVVTGVRLLRSSARKAIAAATAPTKPRVTCHAVSASIRV